MVVSLHLKNAFYELHGIVRKISNYYSLEQNGILEPKKKTLMEFARSMLQITKLSKSFWGEAIATTCYIQNWSYTFILVGKLHMNVEKVKPLTSTISKCLVALHMPTSLMTHEKNLNQNAFSVYLLDMVKTI
jgi:hypothetical protein